MRKRLVAATIIAASATIGLVQPAVADDVDVKVKANNIRVCNNRCIGDVTVGL